MNLLADVLTSRKAQALAALVLVALLSPAFIDAETAEKVSTALLAYILGRAVHDHGLAAKSN